MAEELDYIPMPESVVNLVKDTWKAELVNEGQTFIN